MFKSKLMLPILAVIVGVAASAFTTFSTGRTTSETPSYWFQYDGQGNQLLNQTTQPQLSITDPYGCSGQDIDCAQAFTSYDVVQVNGQTEYAPGTPKTPVEIDHKNAD